MGIFDHNCRAWLPSDALARNDLTEALVEMLGRWSAKWFAGSPWCLSRENPTDVVEPDWMGLGDGLAIGLAPHAQSAIAEAMLGGSPGREFKEPSDRRVAQILTKACIDDLKKRVVDLFRLSPDSDWRQGTDAGLVPGDGAYCATIGTGRHVHLAVAHDLFVAWIKARGSTLAQPIALGSLGQGLERQMVELGARIGGCELSLTDLDELGVGDVLVLDRALDHPLELALDGGPVGRRCVIDSTDARLALELVDPLVE